MFSAGVRSAGTAVRAVMAAAVALVLAPPVGSVAAAAAAAAPAQAPPPTATSTTCDADRDPLPAGLAQELAARYPAQRFTAAVLDNHGCAYHLNRHLRVTTASVVKLEVMTGVLLRAQREGRGLTQHERDLIWPMITESANPPTTQLWSSLGGAPAMEALDAEFGMTDTVHASPTWGLTSSSAADQVHLIRQVWTGNAGPLGAAMRAEARFFLSNVVPEQRWGASAGVPAGWTVGQKNGFAPSRCCRWRLNSVGWIDRPDGTGWAVAVLSDGWATQADGIAAVDELTGRINQAMLEPSFTGPSLVAAADGSADVLARGGAGQLAHLPIPPAAAWLDGGGRTTSDLDAVAPPAAGGGLRAVARGIDGQPYLGVERVGHWSWQSLEGSCSSGPSATYSGPDRFDVSCRGLDGQLWNRTWTTATGWRPWLRIGGLLSSDPDVASPSPAHAAQMFARGLDSAVWQFVWNGTGYQLYHLGGQCSSGPSAAYSGPDRVDVYCRGLDGQLWTLSWGLGTGWGSWIRVGGLLASDPDASSPGPGHPAQVVARGLDQAVWRFTRSGDGWALTSLGGP